MLSREPRQRPPEGGAQGPNLDSPTAGATTLPVRGGGNSNVRSGFGRFVVRRSFVINHSDANMIMERDAQHHLTERVMTHFFLFLLA